MSPVTPVRYMRNAWMSPNGDVFEVFEDYGHDEEARRILSDLGIRIEGYDYCSALFDRGWIELSAHRNAYVFVGHVRTLTEAQMSTLWDMYMSARTQTQTRYVKDALAGLAHILHISTGAEDATVRGHGEDAY